MDKASALAGVFYFEKRIIKVLTYRARYDIIIIERRLKYMSKDKKEIRKKLIDWLVKFLTDLLVGIILMIISKIVD